jgi:hypothetical protein
MSSSAPSTPSRDPRSDLFSAMDEELPAKSPPKHTSGDAGLNKDDEPHAPPALAFGILQNSLAAIHLYCNHKGLTAQEAAEVKAAMHVSPFVFHFRSGADALHLGAASCSGCQAFGQCPHCWQEVGNIGCSPARLRVGRYHARTFHSHCHVSLV